MKQLNLFIELIRLKKPIGFMLLFWPCAWGLTIAYDFEESFDKYNLKNEVLLFNFVKFVHLFLQFGFKICTFHLGIN